MIEKSELILPRQEAINNAFYVANKILSLKDINGVAPEVYMVCGNRTAGKTFYFKQWFVRRWFRFGERFVVLVRFIDDIAGCADGFWADIGPIRWPDHTMTQKPLLHGKAAELLIDRRRCGYVIALNDPERIKRNSAQFADAQRGFLDEFMSETGKYVPNELVKFNSIRISIARGGAKGTHARRFPVYMCSNNVTIFNPYFDYFNVGVRLQSRTKFLRGDGWVLEQTFNEAAAAAIKDNFHSMSEKELAYATENKYLLDDNQFVGDVPGNKTCFAGIRKNNRIFGVWQCYDGRILISRKFDPAVRVVIATQNEDHTTGTCLLGPNSTIIKYLRKAYDRGLVVFDNGSSRTNFISALRIV